MHYFSGGLHKWFYLKCSEILERIPENDPSAGATRKICSRVLELTEKHAHTAIFMSYAMVGNIIAAVVLALTVFHLFANSSFVKGAAGMDVAGIFLPGRSAFEKASATLFLCSASYIFVFGVIYAGQEGLRKAADKSIA
jgi:hypothetical protein